MRVTQWIVIGTSRGLGTALVDELLREPSVAIRGISRTPAEQINKYTTWKETGRYRHLQLDITSSPCRELLPTCIQEVAPNPAGIIFNAAYMEQDVTSEHLIRFQAFDQVNQVGIIGLGNVLFAIEPYLKEYGGILMGISSFSALAPPIIPKLAYPSTKAYLDMLLRCLRAIWPKKIKVVTVHLGHIGSWEQVLSGWNVPTYAMTASKIVKTLSRSHIPEEINYPLIYTLMFKYVFPWLPDKVMFWGLRSSLRLGRILKQQS